MGAGYCFGEKAVEAKNINEGGLDLEKKPEEEVKVEPQSETLEPVFKMLVDPHEALTMQSGIRGYLVRKEIRKPLAEVKEVKTWQKLADKYPKLGKPLTEIQSSFVGDLEKKLVPLDIQRPDDGVAVKEMPAVQLDDGTVYEGEWDKHGNKHGLGTLVKEDGSKIVGCFKGGQLEGKGRMIESSGLVFEGEFKNGAMNGAGTVQNKSGGKFDGELADGKLHGKGTEQWPDGTKYKGGYQHGLRHGKGVLEMPDGTTYKGEFSNDKMHGSGKLVYKNGNSYDGEFKDNMMHGLGTFKWADGRVYEGNFKKDQKHGKGKMTWPDDKIYDGDWKDNKQHGEAEYTFQKKDKEMTTRKSKWENGSRVEWLDS
ncbi:hypothetical protein SteCoe_13685 [Stentor coeruleus]|uniref:MORN repeat protein n=1 Tax=Stentor coeruleus TaxID=5963 RepID=A0A1R2C830_9CILI|nr:hypothetical protein SteCoe_13685 [Stentor coeruleus]